jgi:hypothetical protein
VATKQNILGIGLDPKLKGLEEFRKSLVQASVTATETYTKRMAKGLVSSFKSSFDAVRKQELEVQSLRQKLNNKFLTQQQKSQIRREMGSAARESKRLQTELKTRLQSETKVMERRKQALSKVSEQQNFIKGAGQAGEKFGEEIRGAFDDIASKDIGRIFKNLPTKLGGAFQKAGTGLMKKAPEGSLLSTLGGFLSKAGPALMAIGALAGGILAIGKIFLDADAHMKELNKGMLENGALANDLVDRYGFLSKNLTSIGKHFASATALNRRWVTTSKEHMEILAGYVEANVNIAELTAGLTTATEQMIRLEQATTGAVAYARLFGVSYKEMAKNFGEYMTNLGLTLQGVQERFTAIGLAARDSGFSTKRFMGMLLQATSGMSMYNVRIEETAALLVDLARVLGEKMGGDLLQNLTQGLRGESTQDLVKRVKTTGVKRTLGIEQEAATYNTQDFLRKVGAYEGEHNTTQITEALVKAGVTGGTPEEIAKSLGTMPQEMANKLAAGLTSLNPGLAGSFRGAREASFSYMGGLKGAVAGARGMGPGGTLLLELSKAQAVIGKRLDQITPAELMKRMAAEGVSGKQGEEFYKLQAVGQEYQGRVAKLQEVAAQMAELEKRAQEATSEEDKAAFLAEKAKVQEDFNNGMGKQWRVFLDESGNWFREQGGERIDIEKTFQSLVLSAGEELARITQKDVSTDLALAQEIAENTYSVSDILQNTVGAHLSSIFNTVSNIFNWLMGNGEKEMTEQLIKVTEHFSQSMEETRSQISKAEAEKRDLGLKLRDDTLQGTDREAVLREIEAKQGEIDKLKEASEILRSAMAKTRGARTQEDVEKILGKDLSLSFWDFIDDKFSAGEFVAKVLADASKEKVAETRRGKLVPEDQLPLDEKKIQEETEAALKQLTSVWAANGGVRYMPAEVIGGKAEILKKSIRDKHIQEAQAHASGLGQPGVAPVKLGKTTIFPGAAPLSEEEAAKLQDEDAKERQKEAEKLEQKSGKRMADIIKGLQSAVIDEMRKQQEDKLATMLIDAGLTGGPGAAAAAAQALRSGDASGIPSDVLEALRNIPGHKDVLTPEGAAALKPKVNDMVMQIGRGGVKFAQRVDPGDVGVFAKAGGALSQAGRGGGGSLNVFHLYGEGPGVMNTITKAQQAGLLG